MKFHKFFLLFILITIDIYAINIDHKTSKIDILSQSYIYIDNTNTLTKEQVLQKKFTLNNEEVITLGFNSNKSLWIKFTLQNNSDRTIEKVLSYNDTVTDEIYIYYDDKEFIEGKLYVPESRKSIYPSKNIILKPFENKTFLIKAFSSHSSLIASVWLYSPMQFIKEDYTNKTYIFIFFSIMAILFIYNFFLWVFTKDNAYKYYLAYLLSLIFFQANYYGVTYLYFYSQEVALFLTKGMMGYIVMLVISMLMFTRVFLNTPRFRRIDFTLKAYIYFIIPIPFFIYYKFLLNMNVLILFIPLGLSIIVMALYIYLQGVKEAKFYLMGWSFVILSFIMITIKTLGVFDIYEYIPYFNELAFVLEALLFAIALAHRIDIMREEKLEADEKFILLQKEEKEKLQTLVDEKTKDITALLNQKEILYQELNHRVKNNLLMILSLVNLQISNSSSEQTKNELQVTKNRINSITSLYENLHLDEQMHEVSTYEYISTIIDKIKPLSAKNIDVIYDIRYELEQNQLLYTGLILNELATNVFKYAYNSKGELHVSLYKQDKNIIMSVKDHGKGISKDKRQSLGLTIVNTLVTKQLNGTIDILSDNGTEITISWEESQLHA